MSDAPPRPLRVAVLLSGSGTSLENLFHHIERRGLPARVVCVLSSRADAFGLERARRRGVPAVAVPRRRFGHVAAFEDALHAELAKFEVDLVALLGFLSLFPLRGKYEGRVINTHPALVPAFSGRGFYGRRVYEAVLEAGVRVTGATVHVVDEEYDGGPILLQEAVPVLAGDSVESLTARVQAVERRLVPEAVRLFAEGRVRVEGGRVRILPPRRPPAAPPR